MGHGDDVIRQRERASKEPINGLVCSRNPCFYHLVAVVINNMLVTVEAQKRADILVKRRCQGGSLISLPPLEANLIVANSEIAKLGGGVGW